MTNVLNRVSMGLFKCKFFFRLGIFCVHKLSLVNFGSCPISGFKESTPGTIC